MRCAFDLADNRLDLIHLYSRILHVLVHAGTVAFLALAVA